MKEPQAYVNTDRELWRQPADDERGTGMEPYVFVTEDGRIGMNHYGTVVMMSIADWVQLYREVAPLP